MCLQITDGVLQLICSYIKLIVYLCAFGIISFEIIVSLNQLITGKLMTKDMQTMYMQARLREDLLY